MYDVTGTSTVWYCSGASGLEKRQCIVQLTILVDGVPHVKPLLIFRGKGLQIPQAERNAYDCKVVVKFQENAWCDDTGVNTCGSDPLALTQTSQSS